MQRLAAAFVARAAARSLRCHARPAGAQRVAPRWLSLPATPGACAPSDQRARVPCWLHDSTGSGLTPYPLALAWQRELLRRRTEHPSAGAERPSDPAASPFPGVVLVLEHPHVYTLGRGASVEHLKFKPESIQSPYGAEALPGGVASPSPGAPAAAVYRVERGGKITYHGPGQLVVYPLLDLHAFKKDLHWYVETIEEVIIRSLAEFGVAAARAKGYPGVWVGVDTGAPRKIAQVGMNVNRWYTMHGFAVNVDPDMAYFGGIVPCGIADKEVTSLALELEGRAAGGAQPWDGPTRGPALLRAYKAAVLDHFQRCFGAALLPAPPAAGASGGGAAGGSGAGADHDPFAAAAAALAATLDETPLPLAPRP